MGKSLRGKRLKRLGLFWVGVFLSFSLWAQTGVICGTVTDAKIKEPLIGASVVIEGTTVGAITDIDGNFRIENVKPGTYTVAASYVSYQTQTVKDVPVVACQEAVLNIELSDANLQLQNVVVVAQRKLGTEMAVLNTVRKSLPVVNGISAQQISKTQDSDAAEVLRRIPGITIVDDRFIVVRGLAQRYNNVWLNNATTPSSETDSRAFSFDVLPSSLIDNMMIYKSPSAELPADFSGGFVRVMTKNIPDGNTFNVSYQMGFNTNATFRNFQLTDGTAKDYLGFGADVRNLPSSFPAHLGEHSTDEAAAFTRQINQRWGINKFTAIPDQKISLTSHRSYDVGGWKIGNITNLNWSTEFDYSETVNNNYIAYDVKNDVSRPRFEYNDIRYKNTSKLGALFNWSFQRVNLTTECMVAASKHDGLSVIEVLVNCMIFNNGTHKAFAGDKEVRAEHTITLRQGEKMLFGKNMDKGLMLDNMKLKVVTVGENGVTLDDILVHDAHEKDTMVHVMLASMKYPDFPVALGIIRDVAEPTYEREVARQIAEVQATAKIKNVDDLLNSGETWEAE